MVQVGDNNSEVAQHMNQFVHSIDFDHVTIVDKACNFHKGLFLNAWYSQRDSDTGNEHIRDLKIRRRQMSTTASGS